MPVVNGIIEHQLLSRVIHAAAGGDDSSLQSNIAVMAAALAQRPPNPGEKPAADRSVLSSAPDSSSYMPQQQAVESAQAVPEPRVARNASHPPADMSSADGRLAHRDSMHSGQSSTSSVPAAASAARDTQRLQQWQASSVSQISVGDVLYVMRQESARHTGISIQERITEK